MSQIFIESRSFLISDQVRNRLFYFVLIGGLIGLSVLAVLSTQLTPQPERFTELYFSDQAHLPTVARPQAVQAVHFTVHNLEHQAIKYRYDIVAATLGGKDVKLGTGMLSLAHRKQKTVAEVITVPALGDAIKISVQLSYQGLVPGRASNQLEQQSIHYWLRVKRGPDVVS